MHGGEAQKDCMKRQSHQTIGLLNLVNFFVFDFDVFYNNVV